MMSKQVFVYSRQVHKLLVQWKLNTTHSVWQEDRCKQKTVPRKSSRVTPPTLSNGATAPPAVSAWPSTGSRTTAALPGAHIDLQFGVCFGSANSRQTQTPSSRCRTAGKHSAYLPPARSVAVCWGRAAAVPAPRGDGLQRRRKRCCPVFLIAPPPGHWAVLGEQEQNTASEINTELKFKNTNTMILPLQRF